MNNIFNKVKFEAIDNSLEYIGKRFNTLYLCFKPLGKFPQLL